MDAAPWRPESWIAVAPSSIAAYRILALTRRESAFPFYASTTWPLDRFELVTVATQLDSGLN